MATHIDNSFRGVGSMKATLDKETRALIETLTAALDECEDYFDSRADADFDDGMFIPNEEMKLMIVCRDALAAAKKEGF